MIKQQNWTCFRSDSLSLLGSWTVWIVFSSFVFNQNVTWSTSSSVSVWLVFLSVSFLFFITLSSTRVSDQKEFDGYYNSSLSFPFSLTFDSLFSQWLHSYIPIRCLHARVGLIKQNKKYLHLWALRGIPTSKPFNLVFKFTKIIN